MGLVLFVISFIAILVGCEFFTNGVEWAGKRLRLSESAVGSILAAIGTAMPETILPLAAFLILGGSAGQDIGTGSIIGSPFTLSTLALFLCGLAALTIAADRKTRKVHINGRMVRRILSFFLLAYTLAAVAAFLPAGLAAVKPAIAIALGMIYLYYVYSTLRAKCRSTQKEEMKPLYFSAILHKKNAQDGLLNLLIAAQILLALAAIVGGADIFVNQVERLSAEIGVSPFILSLLMSPMATELPEIFNSVIWVKEDKDVFAVCNILGSMVYQSCILVIIGIAFTPWHLDLSNPVQVLQAASIGMALASSAYVYLRSGGDTIHAFDLLAPGLLYFIFLALVLLRL